MPKPTAKIQGASIVLLGAFNPAIIQPEWLATTQLISREDAARVADRNEMEIVSPQVSSFSVGSMSLQVTQDRFTARAADSAAFEHLKNLVVGVFRTLEHTPMSAMGILWRGHYPLGSEENWHALGDALAPKDEWKKVLSSPIREGTPGLRTIIIEGTREQSSAKWIRVRVEPSARVQHGAYVELHEEYGYEDQEPTAEVAASLIRDLDDVWAGFLRDAGQIAETLLGAFTE